MGSSHDSLEWSPASNVEEDDSDTPMSPAIDSIAASLDISGDSHGSGVTPLLRQKQSNPCRQSRAEELRHSEPPILPSQAQASARFGPHSSYVFAEPSRLTFANPLEEVLSDVDENGNDDDEELEKQVVRSGVKVAPHSMNPCSLLTH